MFVRTKKSGAYQYLQLVRSERVDGHVRQQVIATLGRLDVLQNAGRIDALIASCARFAERSAGLEAHERGQIPACRGWRRSRSVRPCSSSACGRSWVCRRS